MVLECRHQLRDFHHISVLKNSVQKDSKKANLSSFWCISFGYLENQIVTIVSIFCMPAPSLIAHEKVKLLLWRVKLWIKIYFQCVGEQTSKIYSFALELKKNSLSFISCLLVNTCLFILVLGFFNYINSKHLVGFVEPKSHRKSSICRNKRFEACLEKFWIA